MIRRFNRLIFIVVVVAVALYIAFLNQEMIAVRPLPGSPIVTHTGIIIIFSFAIGMLLVALVALWFGLQSYLRERSVMIKEKARQSFYENIIRARSFSASEEWRKAQTAWEEAIRKDPTHIIARVELSKTMQFLNGNSSADLLEALRVLDAARAQDPKNTEVLFRAAEINIALNNKTAALDNLALIIYEHPIKRALIMARDISEELKRYQDALEYHKKLDAIGEDDDEALARIRFKQLVHENQTDRSKLHEELKTFIKRNSSHAEALQHLGELELEAGRKDEAAQLLIRSAKITGSKKTWQKAARIWIKNHAPDKAIAAARSIAADAKGEMRIDAEIELIRLYIALNMLEDAKKHCDSFMSISKEQSIIPSKDKMREYYALCGICHSRLGEHKATADSLKKICEGDFYLDNLVNNNGSEDSDAPAPRLSTP